MSGLNDDLRRLRLRLESGSVPSDTELLADVETTYSDLRDAEAEVRSQRTEIAALVHAHDVLQLSQERTLAMVPVPVLVTYADGVIRWANAAAGGLLGMRPGRMVGRSALALVAPSDRPDMSTAVAGLPDEQPPFTRRVTLLRRGEESFDVDITLTCSTDDRDRVTWMLLSDDVLHAPSEVVTLPETLARLSRLTATADDVPTAFQQSVAVVATALGGLDISISAGPTLAPDTATSSSVAAQQLDGAQIQAGEGPCVTSYVTAALVESEDLSADDRWPRLAELVPAGTAVIAAPLLAGGAPLGTLAAYGRADRLLGDRGQACELLATAIAAALDELRAKEALTLLASELEQAMASRAVIEQAKGIVMATRACDADAAFAYLAELSSTQHVKLRELATQIVRAHGVGRP